MPWYWILIIISAIVGPFEAMHALNKARRNREEAERRRREAAGLPASVRMYTEEENKPES